MIAFRAFGSALYGFSFPQGRIFARRAAGIRLRLRRRILSETQTKKRRCGRNRARL